MPSGSKYARWLAKGLCGDCGRGPRLEGRIRCARCSDLHDKRNRRYLGRMAPAKLLLRKRGLRERNWERQGILMTNGDPLTHEVFDAVLEFQRNRCAICDKQFFGVRRETAADHAHENEDGSGRFRGVLCGRKTGCNLKCVPRLDHAAQTVLDLVLLAPDTEEAERRTAAYLLSSPYSQWLGHKLKQQHYVRMRSKNAVREEAIVSSDVMEE